MRRKLVGLSAALVLAVVGTLLLVGYVQSAKNRAVAGETMVDVLVVTKDVDKGTPATKLGGSVKTVQVPAKVRAEGVVTALSQLGDLVAGADLVPGEQVVKARFVSAQLAAQRTDVPPGSLQVTVSLTPERAIGGAVRPGDTVGVLASFETFGPNGESGNVTPNTTNLILHKVLVTAVGVDQQPAETDSKAKVDEGKPVLVPSGKVLVTLALDAPSVERVVFAAEHGTLWLAAEPTSALEAGTKQVTRRNVYG